MVLKSQQIFDGNFPETTIDSKMAKNIMSKSGNPSPTPPVEAVVDSEKVRNSPANGNLLPMC